MKRCFPILILFLSAVLLLSSCADPAATGEGTDPTPWISFLSEDRLQQIEPGAVSVTATLNNQSGVAVTTGDHFEVYAEENGVSTFLGKGSTERVTLSPKTTQQIAFPLSGISLLPGKTCRLTVPCTYSGAGGEEKEHELSFFFFCRENEPVSVPRDLLSTPISDLTEEECAQLAQYLFETYIPCSYGLFSSVQELSSRTLWSSLEALNQTVDGDTSTGAHALSTVRKRLEIYYPGAAFDPTEVRTYDPETETFLPSQITVEQDYIFRSYTVQDGIITICYSDRPDAASSEEPLQYRTALKNASVPGYFSFVSSQRDGAVG